MTCMYLFLVLTIDDAEKVLMNKPIEYTDEPLSNFSFVSGEPCTKGLHGD